jgi:hypothetical protein
MGGLAVVAIIIIALALSGTTKGIATIVQAGLVIAIIGVLLRDAGNKKVFEQSIANLTKLAIGTTGKQTSS